MPVIDATNPYSEMTLEECLHHLHAIKTGQRTFTQDEAVKYAIAVLEALNAGSKVTSTDDDKGM